MQILQNFAELEGKRTNGFIFYDFDHVLSLGLSSSLVRVRPVLPLACSAEDSPFYAFLVIYRNISKGLVLQEIDNAGDSRFKRDAKDNEPNKVKKNQDLGCQLIPWTVDFARLSSFIVAPLKYNANSCQGHCGRREKGFDRMTRKTLTNYELLRVFLLGEIQPEHSCCQPTKYGSQALAYANSTLIIITSLPHMRVLECACHSECYSSKQFILFTEDFLHGRYFVKTALVTMITVVL